MLKTIVYVRIVMRDGTTLLVTRIGSLSGDPRPQCLGRSTLETPCCDVGKHAPAGLKARVKNWIVLLHEQASSTTEGLGAVEVKR
jgi:hypothetical protein